MRCARVRLKERSYDVLVGRGLLDQAGALLRASGLKRRKALVVTQKPVALHYLPRLTASLSQKGFEVHPFIVAFSKSSEAAKSSRVFWQLVRRLAKVDGLSDPPFILALGGGVIGDLAGFAAAVYRRGTPYVQVPTTLTAQVDSAIGGKTAIDIPEGKNLLGAIHQPLRVISDVSVLESLPERHWSDGFAEVIKYGVIKDAALLTLLEKRGIDGLRSDPKRLEEVVTRCARIKAAVVEADELDTRGVRMALNFGHTAGHAIEAASAYSRAYTHGEAVAVGMLVACDIARALGILRDPELTRRLERILMKFRLPLGFKGVKLDAVLDAMGYDKKAGQGINRFVLPVSAGHTLIVPDVPATVIRQALESRRQ